MPRPGRALLMDKRLAAATDGPEGLRERLAMQEAGRRAYEETNREIGPICEANIPRWIATLDAKKAAIYRELMAK